MEEKNIKAVIYARYSSDNQREESIEGQLRECMAFAEKNDITVLRHCILWEKQHSLMQETGHDETGIAGTYQGSIRR